MTDENEPPTHAANDNARSSHRSPIFNLIARERLMRGSTDGETAVLNREAGRVLGKFLDLVTLGESGDLQSSWFEPANDATAMKDGFQPESRLDGERVRAKRRSPSPAERGAALEADAWRAKLYTGAAFPFAPRPSELFLAGKVAPGKRPRTRYAAPPPPRSNREARDTLEHLRRRLRGLYDAAYGAVTGSTMKQIGVEAGYSNKQAESVGIDRVRLAVGALVDAFDEWDAQERRAA